jgi:transcriptional regulator with XRE-family HTH domain
VISDSFYTELGRRVKERRKELNLTQDILARDLGLQRTSVANLEKGLQRISAEAVVILANALRVPPGDLLPNVSPRGAALATSIEQRAPKVLKPALMRALKKLG